MIELCPFQKEIEELVKNNNRCLFWMARGSGKSFLFDYLTGCSIERAGVRLVSNFREEYWDEYWENFKVRDDIKQYVFATPHSISSKKAMEEKGNFDIIKTYTIDRINSELWGSMPYSLGGIKVEVSPIAFQREYMCYENI